MSEAILIIVENETVPFDSRVWKEAQSLFGAGYQVIVLCPKRKGYNKSHEVLAGVHIYRHPTPPEGNSPIGYLLEFSAALFWEFIFSWWIYFRHGFRVIQGCNPPDNIFIVALPFKLLGIKYIFDHHDANPELYLAKYEKKDFLYRTQVLLEKLTYRFSDVVIATNLSYKRLAVGRGGLDPNNVFVVRNGPEIATFKAVTPNSALKCGKRYLIGYVGTMAMQDGLDILLDVALYIKNKGRRDVHFTCVGGGPALAELRQMVKTKDLADMVNFTGRVPDEDLIEILSTADICVNPDRPCEMNDISTMIKIMEYMALGKPIVQFDLKEGRFSAQDASLYADPTNSIADFAEKLLWLTENPGTRQLMGEQGLRRVNTELAWEYSVPNLLAAYKNALGKHGRAATMLPADQSTELALGRRLYYSIRPVIPRPIQLHARQWRASGQRRQARNWPVSEDSGSIPPGWPGWPGGKRFAVVLTHDVERAAGVARCNKLAGAEEQRGLRSAFGFVPLRYNTPPALRESLRSRGYEIMVHDLHHNGKLFRDPKTFAGKRQAINEFLRQWQARGFSSGAMHHNLPWISRMDMDYSISTYDVDPFEPQACGSNRIFPYWVQAPDSEGRGYVEMPYTLPQDFTLFVLLKERTDAIWRHKLDWIAEKGGMALIKSHPDYMIFPDERTRPDGYPVSLYTDLLDYIVARYENEAWFALPCEVARYWRSLRTTSENPIEWSKTFCPSCQQAHREGWLMHIGPIGSTEGAPGFMMEPRIL
jgi:glycosyltransferase involved in cell wall biosynthesis